MEGGDMLVLSDKVLAIGCSERTSADAVHHLAESLRDHFQRGETTFEHLLMVMPPIRSAMHLDTIFTRTSQRTSAWSSRPSSRARVMNSLTSCPSICATTTCASPPSPAC